MPDTEAPTVTISSSVSGSTEESPFEISISFSEVVNGFVLADINVTNGSASNLVETVSGKSWTADITPSAAGQVSVSVAAGVAEDAVGNENTVSNTFTINYITGIVQLSELGWKIYPNPAIDWISLMLPEYSTQNLELIVFDTKGQLVIHETIDFATKNYMIDVRGLKPGQYFIRVNMGKITANESFILKK